MSSLSFCSSASRCLWSTACLALADSSRAVNSAGVDSSCSAASQSLYPMEAQDYKLALELAKCAINPLEGLLVLAGVRRGQQLLGLRQRWHLCVKSDLLDDDLGPRSVFGS